MEVEDGDPRLARFVRDEGQGLVRFAFLLTGGQSAAAEDLVQTVLTRLLERGIDELDEPIAYARRAIVNEHRSQGRRKHAYLRALRRLGPMATQVEAGGVEDRSAILAALGQLTHRERAAVVLRYFVDLDDATIASTLGCAHRRFGP